MLSDYDSRKGGAREARRGEAQRLQPLGLGRNPFLKAAAG